VQINDKQALLSYSPDWVESIIFGCRMPLERQRFIVENNPHPVDFKRVVTGDHSLEFIELAKNSQGAYKV